jgi:hypothetical protein
VGAPAHRCKKTVNTILVWGVTRMRRKLTAICLTRRADAQRRRAGLPPCAYPCDATLAERVDVGGALALSPGRRTRRARGRIARRAPGTDIRLFEPGAPRGRACPVPPPAKRPVRWSGARCPLPHLPAMSPWNIWLFSGGFIRAGFGPRQGVVGADRAAGTDPFVRLLEVHQVHNAGLPCRSAVTLGVRLAAALAGHDVMTARCSRHASVTRPSHGFCLTSTFVPAG